MAVVTTAADGTLTPIGKGAPQISEFEATAVVASKQYVAEGVVEMSLRREDGSAWPQWQAGSHIDVILPGGFTRQYSLCGTNDDRSRLTIAVLLEQEGRGASRYVHDQLVVGNTFRIRGPRNAFPLADHASYVFLAGGVGITAILPMVREAERAGRSWSLHYAGRSKSTMAYVADLEAFGSKVVLYPADENKRMDLDAILTAASAAAGVYACGPVRLLTQIEALGESIEPTVHTERFTVDADSLVRDDDAVIEVYLETSEIEIEVAPHESVLAAVERNGIGVLSSCRVGTCGTCEVPVLEGTPDHRDFVLDEDDRERNDCMMICVSRSLTRRLVLDL